METLKNVTSRKFPKKVLLFFGREGIYFLETLWRMLHFLFQHVFILLCPINFFLKVTGHWTTEMKSSLGQKHSFTMRHHEDFNVLPTITHWRAEWRTLTSDGGNTPVSVDTLFRPPLPSHCGMKLLFSESILKPLTCTGNSSSRSPHLTPSNNRQSAVRVQI